MLDHEWIQIRKNLRLTNGTVDCSKMMSKLKITVRYLEKHATELFSPNQKTNPIFLSRNAYLPYSAVLWIRIGFLADPHQAYFLNADPDPGIKTNANPCVSGGSKTLLKGKKPGTFVNYGQFPYCWIWIRIPHTDPDPGQPNQSGSGSTPQLF